MLVATGMTKLIETIEAAVRDVLGMMSLKESISSAHVHDMLCEVRHRIENRYDSGSIGRTVELYHFMLPDLDNTADGVAQVGNASSCTKLIAGCHQCLFVDVDDEKNSV